MSHKKSDVLHFMLGEETMNYKKRDMSIEIIRIIACVLVVFAHIQIAINVEGVTRVDRLLFATAISDNVPLFFMISGYFLFTKTDGDTVDILAVYWQKLKSLLRNVLVPITLLIIIIACIEGFIKNECSLSECTFNIESIKTYLYNFYCKQYAYDRAGHFWYICSYMRIFVWFPALAMLCKKDKNVTKARRLLILLSFIVMVLHDISNFTGADYGSYETMIFDKNMIYVILGYEMYHIFNYGSFSMIKLRKYGAILYGTGFFLRAGLQYIYYQVQGTDNGSPFFGMESFTCILTAFGAFMFWHSFRGKVSSRVWGFIGKYTLYIYMFHAMVIDKLNDIMYWNIYGKMGGCSNIFTVIGFYLTYGSCIIAISFVLGFIFERIYAGILYGLSKCIKIKQK